jgi:hypothetical protein
LLDTLRDDDSINVDQAVRQTDLVRHTLTSKSAAPQSGEQ